MNEKQTILEMLFEGFDTAEMASLVENGDVEITDRFGRTGVAISLERAKLLDQIAHHVAMVHERKKAWKYWSEDALHYWAYGKTRPNQDYGGEQLPEIDRAWLKEPEKHFKNKSQSSGGKHSGRELAGARWEPHKEARALVRDAAKDFIERGRLKHNQIAEVLHDSGQFKLSKSVIKEVVKKECYALGRIDLIKGL